MGRLKIGDNLYRKVFMKGIFTYTVFEIRETGDCILYAVRCENCNEHDHIPCEVLVVKEPKREYYNFVGMINNGDTEEYTWHLSGSVWGDGKYHTSRNVAVRLELERLVREKDKEIQELQNSIKMKEQRKLEFMDAIKDLEQVNG